MPSPYRPRSTQMRPRAISDNGLGGFIGPEIAGSCGLAAGEWGTWPKTGRRKPPPLAIGQDDESLLLPASPWSAFSLQSSRSGWTPRTPASAGSDGVQTVAVRSQQSTPLLSRFNSAGLHSNASSNPTTPGPNQLPAKTSAIELPGSLLLPSQGFPPPPATPPRHHILRRQNTDDSETSSVPFLTTLSSTLSSSDSMDVLKSLSGHHWKASHTHGTTAHSNGNNKPSSVSKPFSAMSIEELLISLPSCDSTTITRIWMPEMQNKCRNMKEVLQKAHDNRALSNTELRNIGQDLKAFMQEARTISNTYEGAIRSAESLIERDTLTLQERLHIAESELKQANAKLDASNRLLREKSEGVAKLRYTLREVVRILGSFIEQYVEHWIHDFHSPDVQDVMQVISDYGRATHSSQVQYVRFPESMHLQNTLALHDAHEEIEQWRAAMLEQDTAIKDQSKQLDRQLDKYEQNLKAIKERDHELTLLCQRNTDLEQKVESHERALQHSQIVIAERDHAKRENEELRQEMKQLSGLFKLQVDEKDAKVIELRQKLGSAREEVIARRADVRNVITQTQAMMAPQTNGTANSRRGGVSKSPNPFVKSKEKEKGKKLHFPHSQSGLFQGFSHLNYDMMTSPDSNRDSRYSSKEVIGCDKKHYHLSCGSSSGSARTDSSTPTRGRRASDPFCDMRLRNESAGTSGRESLSAHSQGSGGSSVDVQKKLPAAPPTVLPRVIPSNTLLHPDDALSASPRTSPPALPSPRVSHDTLTAHIRTPARRILSLIPEASVEDSDSVRAASATSSEKEVYRRSIHALDLLNTSELTDASSTGSGALTINANRPDGASRSSSEGSELMTVSQMYHGEGRGWGNGQGHLHS